MTPDSLAAKGSESGHQKALFAWAAMSQYRGFATADDVTSYVANPGLGRARPLEPVPALRWLHSIPNGGFRDPATASLMKAEGARAGVADVSLPVARRGFHGLYIEMKKPGKGRQSTEQVEFEQHCSSNGYAYFVCYTWREAADIIKDYLTGF